MTITVTEVRAFREYLVQRNAGLGQTAVAIANNLKFSVSPGNAAAQLAETYHRQAEVREIIQALDSMVLHEGR